MEPNRHAGEILVERAARKRLKSFRAWTPLLLLFLSACAESHSGVLTAPRPQPHVERPNPAPPPPPVAPAPIVKSTPDRIRKVELGRSVNGAPLTLEIFGDGPECVFIFGGIHGNEPTSAYVARELANTLRVNWDLFEGKTVAILAEANPDGLQRGSRVNAHGVDVNRNFPARNWRRAAKGGGKHGAAPACEPETRAILRAMELIQPRRVVAIHSISGAGRHCNNYDGSAAGLAQLMAGHNGYKVAPTMGYATPGSFGSYAGVDRDIPTITLELPHGQDGATSWRQNREALLAFIRGH